MKPGPFSPRLQVLAIVLLLIGVAVAVTAARGLMARNAVSAPTTSSRARQSDDKRGLAVAPSTVPLALPVKVVVEREGLTAISAGDLRAAGVHPARVQNEQWHLRKGDQTVPLLPVGSGNDLRLVFYAQASDNLYSRQQVYWLEALPEGGLRPATRPVAAVDVGDVVTTVTGTLRLDWRTTYNPRLVDGDDRWLGDSLFMGRELSLPFSLSHLAAGQSRLQLRLWANTASPDANPDHHMQVWLNDHLVADSHYEGQGFWDIQATLPDGVLRAGDNELRLLSPGDTAARVEQVLPDWLVIYYPRALTADAGYLEFTSLARHFRLDGFSGNAELLLWDITDPQMPVVLTAGREQLADTGGAIAFSDDQGPAGLRRYAAADLLHLPAPLQVTPPLPGDLRDLPPADYIAIGPAHLLEALQPLLDWREEQGLAVQAVEVNALYEQFGAGQRGPEAIRSFLRYVSGHWPSAPRFVLLVGDGSYDPRGYIGSPAADQVPTCLVDTDFIGETASDHCYADLDDDLAPDVAVGRLPAQRPAQVTVAVDKIIAYEQTALDADWLRRALLVADSDLEFSQASDQLAADVLAPAGYDIETVYLGDPALNEPGAARKVLVNSLEDGVGVVNYAGHGSPRWWAGELLSSDDAADLPNAGRWPIFTAMTCLTGFFQHPTAESLAEALLWADGGAIAAFMPSSEGVTWDQLPLAVAFYRQLTASGSATLGEAIVAAKRELVQSGASSADMILTFNLLGDPALSLSGLSQK